MHDYVGDCTFYAKFHSIWLGGPSGLPGNTVNIRYILYAIFFDFLIL